MTRHAARRRPLAFVVCLLLVAWPASVQGNARIVFDTKIDGKPVRLAFDTGATHLTLFRKTADRLGLKVNPFDAETARTHKVNFTGITDEHEFRFCNNVVQAKFHVFDVPPGLNEPDVEGVIGWVPLRQNVIVFDGDRTTAEVGAALPKDLTSWQKLRVRREGVLQIEVPMPNDKVGVIFVDSGNLDGATLPPETWKQWSAKHADLPSTLTAFYQPASGLVVRKRLWASQLQIGELHLQGVPVQEATVEDAAIPDFVATIGIYGLRRMQLIVDGANDVAYIKPSAAPPPPFPHNRLGAVFVPRDLKSDPLLAHVVPGSPAALAGIRDGDILKRIDDLDVTKWRTDPRVMPMSRFFERPAGTKVRLTLEQGGERRAVDVVLKDILGPS